MSGTAVDLISSAPRWKIAATIRTKALGAIARARTVPQLFVNGELIGDSQAIENWVAQRTA